MMKSSSLLFPSFAVVIACGGVVLACNVDADIAKSPTGEAPRDDAGVVDAPSPNPTSAPNRDAGTDGAVPPTPAWQAVTSVAGGAVIAASAGSSTARYLWPQAIFGDGAEKSSCESRTVPSGAHTCTVSRCTVATQTAKNLPHAGAIDFGGLATITPRSDGVYNPIGTSPPWNPGSTIAINAAGGVIPAFAGNIAVPTDLTVTSPAGGSSDVAQPLPTALSKTAGLHVAWEPSAPASQVVQIAIREAYSASPPMYQYAIACLAPRGDGALDVPAAALSDLSELPLASGGPHVTVGIGAYSEQIKTVGAYRVQLLGLGRGVSMTATNQIVP